MRSAAAGVCRIPGTITAALFVMVAELYISAAIGIAAVVTASVIHRVGICAAVGLRAGQNVVAGRQRVANAVDKLPLLGDGEFFREVAAAPCFIERISVYFRLDNRPLEPASDSV